MFRHFTWAIGLTFIATSVAFATNIDGKLGGFRVQSAEEIEKGYASLSYFAEYFYQDTLYFGTQKHKLSDNLFLQIAPTNNFLLYTGRKTNTIYSESGYYSNFTTSGILDFGFMTSKKKSEKLVYGLDMGALLYYGTKISLDDTLSPHAKFILSHRINNPTSKNLLFLHNNFQYKYNLSHKATQDISPSLGNHLIIPKQTYHHLKGAVGLEYQTTYVDLILEYTLEYLINSNTSLFKHPHYVTTGLKIKPFKDKNLKFHLGADFGLNKGDYLIFGYEPAFDYNIFAGISLELGKSSKKEETIISVTETLPPQQEPIQEVEIEVEENKNLLLKFRKPGDNQRLLLKFRK
ncbi:MAG: hypothetical protein HYW47_05445 [Deltaproteobacteria bacterium]|nr:hypothetical protein [Deltaproteobacteria bacterium]